MNPVEPKYKDPSYIYLGAKSSINNRARLL
jgi:hypothetical protein